MFQTSETPIMSKTFPTVHLSSSIHSNTASSVNLEPLTVSASNTNCTNVSLRNQRHNLPLAVRPTRQQRIRATNKKILEDLAIKERRAKIEERREVKRKLEESAREERQRARDAKIAERLEEKRKLEEFAKYLQERKKSDISNKK